MQPQVFIFKVPPELTIWKDNDVKVIVKVDRKEDGSVIHLDFFDLKTETICAVKNWMRVWTLALQEAEKLWNANEKLDHVYQDY